VAKVTRPAGTIQAMARSQVEEVARALQDAAYVGVGLGVLAFQRAQVRRQELRRQVGRLTAMAEERVQLVEERLDAVEDRVGATLGTIEERLPDQVAAMARQARSAARGAGGRSGHRASTTDG
jgi:hypothetical protein